MPAAQGGGGLGGLFRFVLRAAERAEGQEHASGLRPALLLDDLSLEHDRRQFGAAAKNDCFCEARITLSKLRVDVIDAATSHLPSP